MSREYFAKRNSKDMANHVMGFIQNWQTSVGNTDEGMAAVWYRNLRYYYSNIFTGYGNETGLGFAGEQGELVKMVVPQARALTEEFLSLTTKQRLNFECEAQATDAATMADTKLANALTQQIVKKERVDAQSYKMAEMAALTGAGYLMLRWDMLKGKKRAVAEDGSIMYSGDLDVCAPSVFDILYDYTQEDFYKLDWVLVRTKRNRWDLVAKYPEMETEIMNLPQAFKDSDTSVVWHQNYSEDMVWTYEFFHRSTPALPQGRYAWLADNNCIFHDDFNPYVDPDGEAFIPVVQMKPAPIADLGFGYPFFSNILPLQEMLDHQFSAIATNNVANAVQTILNPTGNDISVSNIGGVKFCSYKPMNVPGGGKPEALQLTSSSPEAYKFTDMMRSYMMEISKINGALRGSPPPGVTSGTAIATLTTNAIEFSQAFTKSYVEGCEMAMTFAIWCYRIFADEPMLVSMVGPNNSSIAKEFVGQDLSPIKRVSCKIANPLMATAAGKYEIAQNLLQNGLIKNPRKYFMVLEGAPIESLYADDYSQETLIQRENDELRMGKSVIVVQGDDHPAHMASHFALLNDPEIRRNGTMVQTVLDHVDQHYQQHLQTPPDFAQMIRTGMPVPPPPPGAPGPGGPGGPPPPQALPPEAGGPDIGGAEPAEPPVDISQSNLGGITPPTVGVA